MGRLEITTHIGCPINCMDCPQGLLLKKYQSDIRTLNLENYKKAIDKVPKNVRIDFSGMCEPFVNKDCSEMILYAYRKGNPLALYSTLQGATLEDYEALKNVKYEVSTIHIPDQNGRSTFKITDEYLKVLSLWECDNYSCHGEISDVVKPYLKSNKHLITFMHDRAGNLETQKHININIDKQIFCINSKLAFDHNVMLPNGDVYLCCMDYGLEYYMGNLFTQTYEEILVNKKKEDLLNKMIGMTTEDCICRKCINAREI